MPIRRLAGAIVALSCTAAATASAQPLGTFRWQQQPYCNVLTVNVVQAGGVYQLDGVDDQCGAATQASVVGLAFHNPNGTIGIGLTIVTAPGATPVHLDATLNLPSVNGTWRDSAGAIGPFVITPGAPAAGSPRPVPRAAFPGGVSVGGTTITNVAAPVAATDAANKSYVDAAAASTRAAILNTKVWSAMVWSTGAKFSTGRFTSARNALGIYTVVFNLTGLGVADLGIAPVAVTPITCPGGSAQVASGEWSESGGMRTTVSLLVETTNASGAAVDCAFFVMLHSGDPDAPNSPVPPLGAGTAGPRCSTTGEVTTCVVGRPE
ncbi:MAG: hypothetical protein AB7U83_01715 [Vicinamibacterales bacterium]